MLTPITISFANGTISCTPDKGNAKAKAAEKVEWIRDEKTVAEFCLRFYREPAQGSYGTKDWPFSGSAPVRPNSTGWVAAFDGVVDVEDGLYRYTIEVNVAGEQGGQIAYLDPMIIIGRG